MKYTSLVFAAAFATGSIADPVSSEAPVVSSEAPVVSSEAPVVSSEAPVVSSAAPVVSSEAPVVSSAAPVVSSEAPVVSSAVVVPPKSIPAVSAASLVPPKSIPAVSVASLVPPKSIPAVSAASLVPPKSIPAVETSTPALWETRTLPEISCPSAAAQTDFKEWIGAVGTAAAEIDALLEGAVLPSVAAGVASLVCEFGAISGNASTIGINAHDDLAAYGDVNAKVATALTDLAAKADTLAEGIVPIRLRARSVITLQDYVESYVSGALSFEMLMSAAIETDTDCEDRVSFSSYVDIMGSAFDAAASVFSLSISELTAPALCTSDVAPATSTVIATESCTEGVVTTVVTEFTTYCPEPTTLCTNGVCHTVTEATTLTITDCPCTITSKPLVVPTGKPTDKAVPTMPMLSVSPAGTDVAPANGAASVGSSMFLAAVGVLAALF